MTKLIRLTQILFQLYWMQAPDDYLRRARGRIVQQLTDLLGEDVVGN